MKRPTFCKIWNPNVDNSDTKNTRPMPHWRTQSKFFEIPFTCNGLHLRVCCFQGFILTLLYDSLHVISVHILQRLEWVWVLKFVCESYFLDMFHSESSLVNIVHSSSNTFKNPFRHLTPTELLLNKFVVCSEVPLTIYFYFKIFFSIIVKYWQWKHLTWFQLFYW